MEDYYQHRKQYCREGESDSTIALGVALICCAFVLFWIGVFIFL